MRSARTAGLVLLLGLVPGLGPRAEDTPAAIVKYRQSVMKAMGGSMGALSAIVKGEVSFPEHAAVHASDIHAISELIPELFPPGSGPDRAKTAAKPEIWRRWAEFQAAAQKVREESAKLVRVAQAHDTAGVKTQFGELGKACSSCHDSFRVRDEE
jgi:cytochrome c556